METILPNELIFIFNEVEYKSKGKKGVYSIKKKLTNDLVCNELTVRNGEDIIDTVEKNIKLQKGDVLHFEYTLDVELLG